MTNHPNRSKRSDLNAGVIVREFPIVAGRLKIGQSEHVTYYGRQFTLTRTGAGEYDLVARAR